MSDKMRGNYHIVPYGSTWVGDCQAYKWSDGIYRTVPEPEYLKPAPPRDTYDLAEMIVEKVQSGTWTAQSVADAIERLYEAREKGKI